ncbi:MAG: hypothetical protein JWO80_1146 [Bryobacterales bacterium]|nr:hypothetical protein [Bryobacterales bacterium]
MSVRKQINERFVNVELRAKCGAGAMDGIGAGMMRTPRGRSRL